MATMGLSRTVSEINGDQSKITNFSTGFLSVFNAPAEGIPLAIAYRRLIGVKNENDGFTGPKKKLDDIV